MRLRLRISAAVLILPFALLASCSGSDGFDVSSKDAFAASCMARSEEFADRLNSVPGPVRVDVPTVASLFASYAAPPPPVYVVRDFDPNVPVPVAGFDRTGVTEAAASCSAAAAMFDRFANVTPAEALRIGLANVMSAVSAEIQEVKDLRRDILRQQDSAKADARRIRQAMDRYAPKGLTFRVAVENGREVPSIVLDVANVVDRPITAFILGIRLVGADGAPIGSGRVRFVPPVPLGPGIENTYSLDLAGVRGIDTKAVLTYSGAVRIFITMDDLFVEGKPMLGALAIAPVDKARVDALDVLMNAMLRYRDSIRLIHERQISAVG